MIVTVWNLAIAGGGALGGIAIDRFGAFALPWVPAALLIGTLLCIGVNALRGRGTGGVDKTTAARLGSCGSQ